MFLKLPGITNVGPMLIVHLHVLIMLYFLFCRTQNAKPVQGAASRPCPYSRQHCAAEREAQPAASSAIESTCRTNHVSQPAMVNALASAPFASLSIGMLRFLVRHLTFIVGFGNF